MESNRGAVVAWTAGVCGGAAALAAVFATFTGWGWRIAVFVLAAIAACALLVLIGTGFRPTSLWLREARRQRQQRKETPRRVITDRWRYTSAAFDVGTLANLGQKGFSHDLYLRSTENKPPAVRFGVFVACGPLADDEPTAEHLRSCMRDCLSRPEVIGLIGKLAGVDDGAEWHSQPGRGRFNLEADLLGPPESGRLFASALLLLPEQGITRYGKDRAGAELYLHVDLPMKDGAPVRAGLAEWHDRFIAALGLPGLLSRFLESVGLMTSGDPAARFAMQLQARSLATIGLDEIVDFGDLAVLSPRKYSAQSDSWAVADEHGKTAGAVSRRFLTELCESTGRTGYEGILADLTDAEGPHPDTRDGPPAAQLNHDKTHLQDQQIEDSLGLLNNETQKALALLDTEQALEAANSRGKVAGHVFISYIHEDSHRVDQLQRTLQAAGIPVWRDTADLWPGEDWRAKIRRAITDNALVFIACFSHASLARSKSYQNEELTLAIEQMRLRRPDDPWLIPVRFDECEIPDRDIGGGRTLTSIQRADLFEDRFAEGAARLVTAILRILGGHPDGEATDRDREPDARSPAITPPGPTISAKDPQDINPAGANRSSMPTSHPPEPFNPASVIQPQFARVAWAADSPSSSSDAGRSVKRWALAIAAGLATFCACWWGLEAGAGWQMGDAVSLATVPFTVVFGVASYWAGQQHDTGDSGASAAKPSAGLSSVIQVVDHPAVPALPEDYRGKRISFGSSRKTMMILAATAILAIDAAAISIWAAVSARPAEAGLIVPGPPWVTSSKGVQNKLTRGDLIRYAFYVDNPTGKAISANIRFDAYWGTRDELPVNIFDLRFQQSIPPGRTTVYSPLTRIPADALPGAYSEQADVADQAVPSDRAGQYGSFDVSGQELLNVPCYVQPTIPRLSGADGGPTSVAMVLNSGPGHGEVTASGVQEFMASYLRHGAPTGNGPVPGEDLEYAIEHYGIAVSKISQIAQGGPGSPQAQLTDMAIAIEHGSPVIAFIDGADLPTGGRGERNYTAHWLVVVGFGLGSSNQTEVLVNDPDGTRGYGGIKGQPVPLETFEQAVMDAGSLPIAEQEPDHISGIVVTVRLNGRPGRIAGGRPRDPAKS